MQCYCSSQSIRPSVEKCRRPTLTYIYLILMLDECWHIYTLNLTVNFSFLWMHVVATVIAVDYIIRCSPRIEEVQVLWCKLNEILLKILLNSQAQTSVRMVVSYDGWYFSFSCGALLSIFSRSVFCFLSAPLGYKQNSLYLDSFGTQGLKPFKREYLHTYQEWTWWCYQTST